MVLYFLTWYTSEELFRDSRPACGGPKGGRKESGDTPEPPAMGLRPPAPPAESGRKRRENMAGDTPIGFTLRQGGLSSPLFLCRLRRHEGRKEGIGGYPQTPTRGTSSPWTP